MKENLIRFRKKSTKQFEQNLGVGGRAYRVRASHRLLGASGKKWPGASGSRLWIIGYCNY
jgi:hypothetical protein